MRTRQLSRRPDRVLRRDKSDHDQDDHLSLADTASAGSVDELETRGKRQCDACPFCADVCEDPACGYCEIRQTSLSDAQMKTCSACPSKGAVLYTKCQVRRHNHVQSCWLVAGDTVYDVTKHIGRHPGGAACILRKAGGAQDCTDDIRFHSRVGRALFQKCAIGKLQPCPRETSNSRNTDWWMFWTR